MSLKSFINGNANERLHKYAVMFLLAWICGLILELALFLRVTPYGPAYVINNWHYLPHAIFYMSYGLALIILPFLAVSLMLKDGRAHVTRQRVFRSICAFLLSFSLLYQHIDNEILRYCGMHITPDFLRTYVLSKGVPDELWALLAADAGGSNLSLYLLGVPAVFLLMWFGFGWRIKHPNFMQHKVQLTIFAAFFAGLIVLPIIQRSPLCLSKNRQALVAPPVILIGQAISTWKDVQTFPKDIDQKLAAVQKTWAAFDPDPWVPSDPSKPFAKRYNGTCPIPDKKYNIIVIAFESFRAYSLKMFNPDAPIEATPYLNSLISDPHTTWFDRYYSSGHPTIGGFMALHTSLVPHSSRIVAKSFLTDQLDSFPAMMRRHRYQAKFFAASDPDWDGQRSWLMKWYDDTDFDPKAQEDRDVMRRFADWLKSGRDTSKPFVATTFLINNHMPFHVLEEQFRVTDSTDLPMAIFNTMRMDDDILQEFITSIKDEPWYSDTLIFITGDHGLDLGDRGIAPDYNNLRAEALQVPLVILGSHPALPAGRQSKLASHIDLGPTILALTGICDDNSFMGHNLITLPNDSKRPVFAFKEHRSAVWRTDYSAYIENNDKIMVYDYADKFQKSDIAPQNPQVAADLKKQADDISIAVDYCYWNDRFHP